MIVPEGAEETIANITLLTRISDLKAKQLYWKLLDAPGMYTMVMNLHIKGKLVDECFQDVPVLANPKYNGDCWATMVVNHGCGVTGNV
jgi:hypothetical protein